MATDNGRLSFFTALRGIEQRLENRLQRVQTRVTTMGWGGTFRSALPLVMQQEISRTERVQAAMNASGLLAFEQMQRMLSGIDLSTIWPILLSMLKDVALYYGSSVVVGAGIGAAIGALGFGVGAIPGAAAGAAAGSEVGAWLLGILGLASLLVYMGDALPEAFND